VSALATTLFLGGWRAPWPLSLINDNMLNHGWWPVLWFSSKLFLLLFCFIWLRGTLPRLRYDQFMRLGWKVLIPASLVWILVVASFRALTNTGHSRPQTIAYVGIPIAVIVLVWSFVAETQASRRERELAELEAAPDEIVVSGAPVRATYPIPVLTGARTLDVAAVGANGSAGSGGPGDDTTTTEVPSG
jgi:NADH-quinone oxidoreductase subunit H